MDNTPYLRKLLVTSQLAWVVFIIQPIVFGFINFNGQPMGPLSLEVLTLGIGRFLTPIAFLLFLGGFAVKKVLITPTRVQKAIQTQWTKESLEKIYYKGTRRYSDEQIQTLLSLSKSEQALVKANSVYFIGIVVSMAFFEAAGTLGFLLASNLQNASVYFPFAALTYIGLLTVYPSYDKLRAVAELT